MNHLQILEAYTDAYKVINTALDKCASGTMPVWQKVKRIREYIDAQARQILTDIESAPEECQGEVSTEGAGGTHENDIPCRRSKDIQYVPELEMYLCSDCRKEGHYETVEEAIASRRVQ